MRVIHGEKIYGIDIDAETRCAHWHSKLDIIAIKFKCCGLWYPCFECHAAVADHAALTWSVDERSEKAILCGKCGYQLSISEYFAFDSTCPQCGSGFNPGCAKHYHLYFE
ncbi:MAG: CHY zinc finger protein [Pyrinomonadaceae bacterium]